MSLLNTLGFLARHPLTRDRPLAAWARFARWQLASRLAAAPIAAPFVGRTRLLASRGMTGATGNIYTGLHEFEDMAFVLHLLREGDVFVDVGANVGSYTVLASGAAGARTIALEPIAGTYEHLVDNVRLNRLDGLVETHNVAAGAEPGELAFTTGLDTTNHVVGPDDETEAGGRTTVRVERLDELVRGRAVTLVKIDVEGFETRVIEGAGALLASPGLLAMLVELNGSGARFGFDEEALHRRILEHGFTTCAYAPRERALTDLGGARDEDGNTLYVRRVDDARERLASARAFDVLGVRI